VLESNEYHKKIARKKFIKLVNKETYIALLFSLLLLLNIKMNIAPKNGNKVIDDNIGKFIFI